MDVTRERISCILELREMFLSFQTGFNLVNAAVICAILESVSGLEPSSDVRSDKRVAEPTVFERSNLLLAHHQPSSSS